MDFDLLSFTLGALSFAIAVAVWCWVRRPPECEPDGFEVVDECASIRVLPEGKIDALMCEHSRRECQRIAEKLDRDILRGYQPKPQRCGRTDAHEHLGYPMRLSGPCDFPYRCGIDLKQHWHSHEGSVWMEGGDPNGPWPCTWLLGEPPPPPPSGASPASGVTE